MRHLLLLAFATIAMPIVLYQSRKPARWLGRPFLWVMNFSHSGLTDWGLTHVAIEKRFTILDVGCGGGRTVRKMAAVASEGTVHGVDYADGSVAASRATNARLIEAGRVKVEKASVTHLPYADNVFDLVTAVETHYYWPGLVDSMREILRVLKPGGTLMICAESYKGGRFDRLQRPVMMLLGSVHLDLDQHRQVLVEAGFSTVLTFEERRKGWMCATATKPRT